MSSLRGALGGLARLCAALLVTAPLVADALAEGKPSTSGGVPVEARAVVAFHPAEPDRRRFGDLEFLGGLVLTSTDPDFQSLSALASRDHGRELLSVSDEGTWVWLRLASDDAGRPQAVAEARLAPLLGAEGRPFPTKWDRDSESLALRRGKTGGEFLVGFEGRHRVLSYAVGDDWRSVLDAPGRPVPGIPRDLATLDANRGLEAVAVAPAGTPLAGTLVLIGEEPRRGEADNPVWLVGGPRPGFLHLARRDRFAVTDAGFLPNGDLIVLQRRFGLRLGLAMRILRVAAADLAPGRTAEGRELLTADWGFEIDNMEGLAVDTAPDGSTVLTLVSDDNGNWFQRTILLRFRLLGDPGRS